MTTTLIEPDLSVRSFLFGSPDDTESEPGLGQALTGRHVAESVLHSSRHLSATVLGAIDDEIGDIAEDMLDIDIGDALVHGWSSHRDLRDAARRTLSTPGSEVVALARHQVTSTYHPNVDLLVDRRLVGSIAFEVRLDFDVTGLAAVLRAGALVALRGGDVVLKAAVLLSGETIAKRQGRIDPELTVRLDPPVVLARPPAD